MTKIDIFSGFLGAGKTTLIKKLIKDAYAGEKIVLIENEFGEIGIDGGFMQDAGITVTSRSPSSITFEVQKQVSMPIEIRGDFTGVSVAEGYMLEKTSFDYDVVQVTGPESVVSTIDCAQVVITRTNLDKTVTDTVPFTLCDKDGNAVDTANLSMDISTVDVTLNVVKYKDVALEVEILDGGGATSKDAKVTIDPESITLSGDSTVLDAINKITLGTIDLADMESNTLTQSFDIIIPNDTKNVSGVDQANVTVTIRNKETAVIRATNIAFIHEPEGLTATSRYRCSSAPLRRIFRRSPPITSASWRISPITRRRAPTPSRSPFTSTASRMRA